MNVVNLMGRLTDYPELRQTPNGISVLRFTIAVDRYVNNEKKADFINCVAWRNNAENIRRYFSKGAMIGITGSIQTRQYQDKDTGKNRTAFEILVDRFHFCGSSNNNNMSATQGQNSTQPQWQQAYGQPQQQGFEPPKQSRFSTADLDGFAPLQNDDGDLPF